MNNALQDEVDANWWRFLADQELRRTQRKDVFRATIDVLIIAALAFMLLAR